MSQKMDLLDRIVEQVLDFARSSEPKLAPVNVNKLIEDLPSAQRSTLAFINNVPGVIDAGFALAQGEDLNVDGNARGPIGSPGRAGRTAMFSPV